MKTETQILEKLTEVVNRFSTMAEALDPNVETLPNEVAIPIASLFSGIMLLGWVLDQEEEIKIVLAQLKLSEALGNLVKAGGGP
jgi:hypothetical protein